MPRRPVSILLAGAALTLAAGSAGAAAPVAGAAAPRATTLPARPPAWYTPEFHQKVLAAGLRGVPTPQEGRMSGYAFAGIRPGGKLTYPAGCTTNFVFQTNPGAFTTSQQLYIGTAGHCAPTVGDRAVMNVLRPTDAQPLTLVVGTIEYTTGDAGVGNDFALIRIDPALNHLVSPSMAHWGGPTGVYSVGDRTAVVHSGHGTGIGTGGTPRAGVLLYSNTNARYWAGESIFGDSGSGVNTATGLAVGNLTHLIVDTGHAGANTAGTNIVRILQLINKPLSVCPTRTPWPQPGCPTV